MLVVEDEFVIASQLDQLLRDFGCVVLGPTNSVARTLALLERERPDAAILDVRLLDGLVTPVAEMLVSMGVPFLLVTGCMRIHRDVPVLRDVPCLDKPFGTDELRLLLLRLLEG